MVVLRLLNIRLALIWLEYTFIFRLLGGTTYREQASLMKKGTVQKSWATLLERIYKPHYDYQNFPPLANGTYLNRQHCDEKKTRIRTFSLD